MQHRNQTVDSCTSLESSHRAGNEYPHGHPSRRDSVAHANILCQKSTLKFFTCEPPYKISQLLAQGPVGPPIQNAKLGLGPIQKVQNQLGSWRGPIQKVQNQLGARCKLCESGTLKFFTCQLPYKIFPTSCARPSWASHTKMQNLVSAPYKKFKTSWVVRRAPYKKFKTSWNLGGRGHDLAVKKITLPIFTIAV